MDYVDIFPVFVKKHTDHSLEELAKENPASSTGKERECASKHRYLIN